MPFLADILLDIATEDPSWFDWSASRLRQAANRDGLAINPIVYAELSVHFETIEALEAALNQREPVDVGPAAERSRASFVQSAAVRSRSCSVLRALRA